MITNTVQSKTEKKVNIHTYNSETTIYVIRLREREESKYLGIFSVNIYLRSMGIKTSESD